MSDPMEARVERNLARMLRPSYGWWILALIPASYAVMVIATYLFDDTTLVDALKLSPGDRQFMVIVIVGTLLELGVQQVMSRRRAVDEPDSPINRPPN